MRVAKWGNSLAVRLPAALVHKLGIAAGDVLELRPEPRRPGKPVRVALLRKPDKPALLHTVRAFRAPWPADFTFDRDEANAR